jgi:hypothetical protein
MKDTPKGGCKRKMNGHSNATDSEKSSSEDEKSLKRTKKGPKDSDNGDHFASIIKMMERQDRKKEEQDARRLQMEEDKEQCVQKREELDCCRARWLTQISTAEGMIKSDNLSIKEKGTAWLDKLYTEDMEDN